MTVSTRVEILANSDSGAFGVLEREADSGKTALPPWSGVLATPSHSKSIIVSGDELACLEAHDEEFHTRMAANRQPAPQPVAATSELRAPTDSHLGFSDETPLNTR